MNRKSYSSDLTDGEWALLAPFIPPPQPGGRPDITKLREGVTALKYSSENYKPSDPQSDPTACSDELKVYASLASAYTADVEKVDATFKELQKGINENQGKFDDMAKIINSVNGVIASGGNPFRETHYLSVGDDEDREEFTIARRNLRVKDAAEVAFNQKPTYLVGESRLSLSAGFGFSTINEIKIVRQASLIPGENGEQAVGNRFGFENRSKFRPSGVLMLNANLRRFGLFEANDTTFAVSSGVVLSNRSTASGGDNLAAEFIAGPSLGFLNNRMFMTFGFHAARVEQLSGGFKIGDPVPANLSDPLPVEKNWRNGLMFAITYRITSQ